MELTLSLQRDLVTSLTAEQIIENLKTLQVHFSHGGLYNATLIENDAYCQLVVDKPLTRDVVLDLSFNKNLDRLGGYVPDCGLIMIQGMDQVAGLPKSDFASLVNNAQLVARTLSVTTVLNTFTLNAGHERNIEALNKFLLGPQDYIVAEFKRNTQRIMGEMLYRIGNNNCNTFEEACRTRNAFGRTSIGEVLDATEHLYPDLRNELKIRFDNHQEKETQRIKRRINANIKYMEYVKANQPTIFSLMGGSDFIKHEVITIGNDIIALAKEFYPELNEVEDWEIRQALTAKIEEIRNTPVESNEPAQEI